MAMLENNYVDSCCYPNSSMANSIISRTSAVEKSGSLWVWGRNNFGQLGHIDEPQSTVPRLIENGKKWIDVSGGYDFLVAIREDGTLWSCGKNDSGQLGHGKKGYDDDTYDALKQIGTDTDWVKVKCGYNHSLALKADGTLWAWGSSASLPYHLNRYPINNLVPNKISYCPSDDRFLDFSIGIQFTVAIAANGNLCFYAGKGGNHAPREFVVLDGSDNWIKVSSMSNHFAALKSDGSLWIYGSKFTDNQDGNIVNGTTVSVNEESYELQCIEIPDKFGWKDVSAGSFHTLAIREDGTLWAWGFNIHGELGTSDTMDRIIPTRIAAQYSDWVYVHAGHSHSFALRSNGTLWAWGDNYYGQLGLNDRYARQIPTLVGENLEEDNWIMVIASAQFSSYGIRAEN